MLYTHKISFTEEELLMSNVSFIEQLKHGNFDSVKNGRLSELFMKNDCND